MTALVVPPMGGLLHLVDLRLLREAWSAWCQYALFAEGKLSASWVVCEREIYLGSEAHVSNADSSAKAYGCFGLL